MSEVTFNQVELNDLLKGPDGPVAKDLATRMLRVQAAATRLAPVDTGRLRSSISSEIGTDSYGLVAYVGTDVEYAAFVEFGTSRMTAQPYLRPALEYAGVEVSGTTATAVAHNVKAAQAARSLGKALRAK